TPDPIAEWNDALQLESPHSGAAADTLGPERRHGAFDARRRPGRVAVPDPADPRLSDLLRGDDVSVSACAVRAFPVEAGDGLDGQPARLCARRGGDCAGYSDRVERKRPGLRTSHRKLPDLLRTL